MPGNKSSDVVPLKADFADRLVGQICRELQCGGVYEVNKTSSSPNITCFHNCFYSDGRLQNCSQTKGSECTVIAEVTCGKIFLCFERLVCFLKNYS